MDAYLDKARQNMDAAKHLLQQDSSLHIAAVHPAYYAVFQTVKYILDTQQIMDYATQDSKAGGSKSHKILIDEITKDVKKHHSNNCNNMCRHMSTVRLYRKKADYNNSPISENSINEFYSNIQDLFSDFDQIYNVKI